MFKSLAARLAFILVLVAVLARAAIPAGFMPSLSSDSFQMVICTLEGSKKITVEGNFNPVPDHNKKMSDFCDFSLTKNLSFDAPIIASFVLTLARLDVAFAVMLSQIARRALRLPVLQSRAPPCFV